MVFESFWSEIGYNFYPYVFWSESLKTGMDFAEMGMDSKSRS